MKITKRIALLVVSILFLGVAAGYFIGVRSERERIRGERNQEEWVHVLTLANSALNADLYTRFLKGLHSGQQDLMMDRLETLLDFALIDLAREYSPARDNNGNAAKALQLAKEYRAAHPHRSKLDDVAKQVDAALAITPKASP